MAGFIGVRIDTTGLSELIANFNALASRVGAGASEVALGAAEDARAAGDPLTPVRTGFLKSNNATRLVGPGEAEFYNDTPYAVPVCAGHHTRSGSWVPAQDWMTPAFYVGEQSLARRLAALLVV